MISLCDRGCKYGSPVFCKAEQSVFSSSYLMNIGGHNKEREKLGSRASVHTRKSVTSAQIQSFSRGKDECESEIIKKSFRQG